MSTTESELFLSEPAFDRLVLEHAGLVLGIARQILGDRDMAEDAVQWTWAKAWSKWRQKGLPDCVPAWLRRVAEREALTILREQRGRGQMRRPPVTVLQDNEPARADESASDGCCREIAGLVDRLPEQERRAMRMLLFEEANYDAIAATLGMPRGSISALVKRARRRLRQALGGEM